MQLDEFIEVVQSRALFNSTGATVLSIRAVLEVLGERLAKREAERLAAQLPPEFGPFLLQPLNAGWFGLDEFLKRISRREKTTLAEAESHARAVLSVIAENIPPGGLHDILTELPDGIRALFAPMRPAVS